MSERTEATGAAKAEDLAAALRESEARLRRREARWRALVQNSNDIIAVIGPDGAFRYITPSALRQFGYDEVPVLAASFDLVHPDDRDRVVDAFAEFSTQPGKGRPTTFRVRHADGSYRWVEVVASNLFADPVVSGLVINARDVTDRQLAQQALEEGDQRLRESEARFRALVNHSGDIVSVLSADGVFVSTTSAVTHVLGFLENELVGRRAADLVHPDDVDEVVTIFSDVSSQPGSSSRVECRLRTATGEWVSVESAITNLLDDPAVGGLVLNTRDVTARVAAEEMLAVQAYHDSLTGLPNRSLFLDRLGMALARGRRRPGTVAVLFLDLDRFKIVNDSLGHEAGDRLLVAVADRLRNLLRPGDTVARFGGDEFTVLCENVHLEREPVSIAERIARALSAPFQLGEREVFLSTSIGIAVASRPDDDPESLLREADSAMYRAKENGRARFELFDEEMRARAMIRLDLETTLHRAMERGELTLQYQPIVDVATRRAVAVEALLRWQHPELGPVATDQFIPLAEETGLILPIGTWVIEQACTDLARWQRDGLADPGLRVWVNLAAAQLGQPELSRLVGAILTESRLDGTALGLEITEGALLHDTDAAIAGIRALKELGVSISIDDFGTGYSSLAYLKRLPIDGLKIDRSFISGLGQSPEDEAIVAAVTTLAANLGLEAVGEGVESEAQIEALGRLGCGLAQGFWLSQPLAAADLGALLSRPFPPA